MIKAVSRPGRAFWLVLAAGLLVRLFLLPIPNTDDDVVFQTWSRIVTVEGFHTIYDVYDPVNNPPRECHYPPGYLYVLWAVGSAYQLIASPEFRQETITFLMVLRVPTVIADLAVGAILFFSVRSWWGPRAAVAVQAAYVLMPATILDSTIVTQIDPVQSLLMVGTTVLLVRGRTAAAVACLTLAILTKPQAAMLAPVVLSTAIFRREWRPLAVGLIASVAITFALCLPFLLNNRVPELARTLLMPVGTLPHLSANAFNLWWLVSDGNGWQPDTLPLLGPLNGRVIGLLLFGLAAAAAVWRLSRDRHRDSILLSAAFVTLSFFMLCTEMTERYLVASVPLFLLLAPSARRYLVISAVLAVTLFLSLYLVFPLLALSPLEALGLPHSNYFYNKAADGGPLPVLRLLSDDGRYFASLWIARVNVAVWLVAAGLTLRTGRSAVPGQPGTEGQLRSR